MSLPGTAGLCNPQENRFRVVIGNLTGATVGAGAQPPAFSIMLQHLHTGQSKAACTASGKINSVRSGQL
jgi:hypothetical protein